MNSDYFAKARAISKQRQKAKQEAEFDKLWGLNKKKPSPSAPVEPKPKPAKKSAALTPATAAVTKMAKRQAAKAKSSARNNTENNQYSRANRAMVLKQRRALNRQAKADWAANAPKRAAYNSVIHNAPVPKGTPIRISATDKQAAINKQRMAAQNAGMRAEAKAKAKEWARRNAKVRSSDRYDLVSTKPNSPERKAQAAKLRADRAANRSGFNMPKSSTPTYKLDRQVNKRAAAFARSNQRNGITPGLGTTDLQRKAKADDLRAQRALKRKYGSPAQEAATRLATNNRAAQSAAKANAITRSNTRHSLPFNASKGGQERKAIASALRADRRVSRMVANQKARAAAAGFVAVRPGSKVGHIPGSGSPKAAKAATINGTHRAMPKVKRPDPGGKKGFARYQAKLNSSKRVYGFFPKGKSATPNSPERRLAARSLRAARAQGLRGPGKSRTAAQRAASIRNLMKARASRMKPGAFRPKGRK